MNRTVIQKPGTVNSSLSLELNLRLEFNTVLRRRFFLRFKPCLQLTRGTIGRADYKEKTFGSRVR